MHFYVVNRTLYVAISIILCIIVAALLLFFLFPRSISLNSNQPALTPPAAGFSQNNTDMFMSIVVSLFFNIF